MPKSQDSSSVKVMLVGAGGLAASFGYGLLKGWALESRLELLIVDPDTVELSNLNRQVFFTEGDLGVPKAQLLAQRLLNWPNFNLETEPTIRAQTTRLNSDNIAQLLEGASVVVDASDCTETKFLLNDFCISRGLPFCYGGAVGSKGLLLFTAPRGAQTTACLRCLFGDFSAEDYNSQTTTCRQAGIFGAVAGHIGLRQAEYVCSYLNNAGLDNCANQAQGSIFERFDFSQHQQRRFELAPAADCPMGCAKRQNFLLDIVKDHCPSTFLYTKLTLEKVAGRGVLEVHLGNSRSARNILQTLSEDGYTVTALGKSRKEGAPWRLLIDSNRSSQLYDS